jgi:NodT family efflux transporter outer membrane factor (OMF) lipoprotein
MRSPEVLIAACMLTGVASGCTVGPDFRPPDAPATTRYTAPGESSAHAADAGTAVPRQIVVIGDKVTSDWWTLFCSPDLDRLVKQSIADSPTLEAAKDRLAAARETVTATTGALYPQIGFSASATREKVSAASFGLHPDAVPLPPNFNLFQIGPTVSYALDIFGGTRRQIEQSAALADVQHDALDAAYLALTGNVVKEAIDVATIRDQQKAVSDTLDIDRQNLALVQRERKAGTVPDSDVVIAESQLAADETQLPGLDQQLSVARHALAVLLGRAPGDWSPPDFELAALTLPGRLPASLPSELVRQRPDIQAAEAQLHAASAQIGIATAQLYPSITLSGGVGVAGLDAGHLFDPAGLVWSVAAGLTQPIFDGGTRQAERRAALAQFKAAAADYRQTVLQAFGQVADILQALTHDADLLAAQQHALDMAFEAMRLQRINYANGGIGILALLDAQRQYQQARVGYVRAEAQRYQDTTQLLVAMGGGWWGANLTAASNNKHPQETHRD